MASLGELFIELGVLGDDEGAKKVAKSIDEVIDKAAKAAKELKRMAKAEYEDRDASIEAAVKTANFVKNIGGIITAVSGAVAALNRLTDSLVQQNQYWVNLTRNSDIALSTYQKWGSIGAAMDKSLGEQGAAGAIAQLNERLFELRLTGEGARGFQLAGIMPTNADDVLEQLRDRIAGMSDTAATYLLNQMGIDVRMLSLLRMSREEFNALNKEMEKYRLTAEQRQSIQEFHKQMSIVNQKMQYFKDRIILAIMPHFLKFMRNIEFLVENLFKLGQTINKATGKFKPFIALLLVFLAKIKPIAKFLTVFNKEIGGIITKIPILGRLLGGLGGIIGKAFLPLTAIYLLLDDVRAFLQGGRSGIGILIALFQKLADKINFEAPEWLKDLVYIVGKTDNLVKGVEAIKDIKDGKDVKVTGGDISTMLTRFNPGITISDWIGNAIGGAIGNAIYNNQNQSKNLTQNINISTNQPASAINREIMSATLQMS